MAETERQKILQKIDRVRGQKDVEALFEKVDRMLAGAAKDTELLHARARLYVMMQKYGAAINDYNSILSIDKNDKAAEAQIGQLKTILRFSNTDIYASPNTNFDPWMD